MVLVVFRSRIRKDADLAGIEEGARRMYELASAMPGFVSYKEFRSGDGELLSLTEFKDEEALRAWRDHPEHLAIQAEGRNRVFETYEISVCQPVRRYGFNCTAGQWIAG